MFEIIFYTIATIFILFLLGYGITNIFIPAKLRSFAFWFSPWYCIIFLIFPLAILSLAGLPVKQIAIPLGLSLLITSIVSFFISKPSFNIVNRENLLIVLFIAASLVLNLSPLIKRHKFLTTVSMGNNDVIVYALVPDYLVSHSLWESFTTPVSPGVDNLLHGGYRWGPPLLSAFFQNILNLDGYQFVYLFQTILFALTIPLIYLLFKLLYKSNLFGLLVSLTVFAFNANLLYMLYHDFFGQVLFGGLELVLFILIYTYFNLREDKTNGFTLFDFNIGIALSALFISYHEGTPFILFPLLAYLTINFIFKKRIYRWFSFLRITIITVIISSVVIVRGIVFDFIQSFGADPNQPIGWAVFRSKIPFANPFEMAGMYSIHSFAPLPFIIAIFLSIAVSIIIFYGLFKSKNKLFLFCYFVFYIFFLLLYLFIIPNFWAYNRSLTYTLPFLLVLFSVGLTHIFRKNKLLQSGVFISVFILVIFSAVKLNKRFLNEHLVVDKSFISLIQLKENKLSSQPIYTQEILDSNIHYWKQIWTSYFLHGINSQPLLPTSSSLYENKIPDDSLVLLSKPTPWYNPPQMLLKIIEWENEYYLLGRLCNSVECLLDRPEDLSKIDMGKSPYEDSLLITGWSIKENESRWTQGNESTLRLVTKNNRYNSLSFEAQTLSEPQTMTVYFDGILLGSKPILKQWQRYTFLLPRAISKNIHQIKLTYSDTYKPSQILQNQDYRDLAVNFKWIKLSQN